MTHRALIAISTLSMLAFVQRMILDLRFVPEMVGGPEQTLLTSTFYLGMLAAWVWSLLETSHARRRGVVVGLLVNLFVFLVIGVGTTVAWCPTPCETIWPWMEGTNWLNNLTAGAAVLGSALALRRSA